MVKHTPYRLDASSQGEINGRLIDRDQRVQFKFNGKTYSGYKGDTLASALMANGVRLVGRSFKYHRPRGILAAGAEEPNAYVTIGSGAYMEPNVRATMVELYHGLEARSQNHWPSLQFDLASIYNMLSRFLPAAFYYKTFMWPKIMWPYYEHFIQKNAGLGKPPKLPDPDIYEQVHIHCDVLVIGGGVAGLAAAKGAAENGAKVFLLDENSRLGGACDLFNETVEEMSALDWASKTVAELNASGNVHLLPRTTAFGHYDHNSVLALERVTDHLPLSERGDRPRARLWRLEAKEIILATGAHERPLVFPNNDRPGIMLASSVKAFGSRYGVAPGQSGIVIGNNNTAHHVTRYLSDQGVRVTHLLDTRSNPASHSLEHVKATGMNIAHGTSIYDVAMSGNKEIRSVTIGDSQGIGQNLTKIKCDFVAMSGGWSPVAHLWCHSGYMLKFDAEMVALKPEGERTGFRVVGSANGLFSAESCIEEGFKNGVASAKGESAIQVQGQHLAEWESKIEAIWQPAVGSKKYELGQKQFVDYQYDVTIADLKLAHREGYTSVEHIKRYTTVGMAPDQGKIGNVNSLGIIAEINGSDPHDMITTTFRPPYTPVTFGAIAGSKRKKLFQPIRKTPIYDWHRENGAHLEVSGMWLRPFCYARNESGFDKAIAAEANNVRQNVGLLDASTLGKIDVRGKDVVPFLEKIFATPLASLQPGKCRYTLMMNENGFLFDDGVIARLAEDHFIVHTTTGNAAAVLAWMEKWHQTEWPDDDVFMASITEAYGQIVVAGPKARDVLLKLNPSMDLSPEALPHMSLTTGTIADIPVRLYRISFSGELSFEIAAPAKQTQALWNALLSAGEDYNIKPYGTEAMEVLRTEKGYVVIGEETDGTVTPLDLGLNFAVSKKKSDYLGKRALQMPDLVRENRLQLVGLETQDTQYKLKVGCQIIPAVIATGRAIGYVTSSHRSPILNRSIALALIENGRDRLGEQVFAASDSGSVAVKIVSPIFVDPKGERLHV